jgi:hypothetical protein
MTATQKVTRYIDLTNAQLIALRRKVRGASIQADLANDGARWVKLREMADQIDRHLNARGYRY